MNSQKRIQQHTATKQQHSNHDNNNNNKQQQTTNNNNNNNNNNNTVTVDPEVRTRPTNPLLIAVSHRELEGLGINEKDKKKCEVEVGATKDSA